MLIQILTKNRVRRGLCLAAIEVALRRDPTAELDRDRRASAGLIELANKPSEFELLFVMPVKTEATDVDRAIPIFGARRDLGRSDRRIENTDTLAKIGMLNLQVRRCELRVADHMIVGVK